VSAFSRNTRRRTHRPTRVASAFGRNTRRRGCGIGRRSGGRRRRGRGLARRSGGRRRRGRGLARRSGRRRRRGGGPVLPREDGAQRDHRAQRKEQRTAAA
jgi:hypothetical protein